MMKGTSMSRIIPLALVLILVMSVGAFAFSGRIPTGKGAEAYTKGEAGGSAEWVVTTYYVDGTFTSKKYGEFKLAEAAVFSPEGEEITHYDFGMSFRLNDGLWASSVAIKEAKLDFVVDEQSSNLGTYSAFQLETIILKGDDLQFDSIEEPKITLAAFEDLEKPLVEKYCSGLLSNECLINGIASIRGTLEIMAVDVNGDMVVMEGDFPPVSIALGVVNGDVWNYQKPSWKSVCDAEGSFAGWIPLGPWGNLIKYDENNPNVWEMEEAQAESCYKGDLECAITSNLVFNKNEYTCTPVICSEKGQMAVNGRCQDIDCSGISTTVVFVLDKEFLRSDGGYGLCIQEGMAIDPSGVVCTENENKIVFNAAVERDGEEIPVYQCVPIHTCDVGLVAIYNEDNFQQQCITVDCSAQGQWTDNDDATKCVAIPDCGAGAWRLSSDEWALCGGDERYCRALQPAMIINGDGTGCQAPLTCITADGWFLSLVTDTACSRNSIGLKMDCDDKVAAGEDVKWDLDACVPDIQINVARQACLARNPSYMADIWKWQDNSCSRITGAAHIVVPPPIDSVVVGVSCGYWNMGNCGTNTWTPKPIVPPSSTVNVCGYLCTQNGVAANSGNTRTSVVVTCAISYFGCVDAPAKTATVVNAVNAQKDCKMVWTGYPENRYSCQMVIGNTANNDTPNSPNNIVNVAGNAGGNRQTSGHNAFGGYDF